MQEPPALTEPSPRCPDYSQQHPDSGQQQGILDESQQWFSVYGASDTKNLGPHQGSIAMNICCKAVWAKTHALQFLIPPWQMNIGWKAGMEEQSSECVLERGVSEGCDGQGNMCLLSRRTRRCAAAWSLLPPEAMLMSKGHAAAVDDLDVSDLCCHLRSY